MTTKKNVQAIRAAVEALNSGDLERYMSAFSPKCQRWTTGVPEPMTRESAAEGLRVMMQAFQGFRLEAENLFGTERYVCAHWRMLGTHTGEFFGIAPTGRPISVDNAEIYEFDREDGIHVTASRSFGDPLELIRQLGVQT